MHLRSVVFALSACVAFVAAASTAAREVDDSAILLGTSGNWSAFEAGSGSSKTCYTMARPAAMLPRKAKRDPVYFLISDWPARKTRSEPEVVAGYSYKDGSTVAAVVDGKTFQFFTRNDGGSGAAWVKSRADELKLVDAMAKGQRMIIGGISRRGTRTTDTYSLSGLSDTLDKIHAACGM